MNTLDSRTQHLQQVDYLIVGQGLAGSLLAWALIRQGQKVLIVDQSHHQSSSMVAAGLVNPIIGKRLNIDQNAQTYLTEANQYYEDLKKQFSTTFFHSLPMLRFYKDQQQAEALKKRKQLLDLSPFIHHEFSASDCLPPFKNSQGGILQKQTGYLDIVPLLFHLKNYFLELNILYDEKIQYDDIQLMTKGLIWKKVQAEHCIFCEGHRSIDNPWFKTLPFQLSKGEIMTLETQTQITTKMVNKGQWLIPIHSNTYKIGATNEWGFQHDKPTESGMKKLKNHFENFFTQNIVYHVSQHQAGIRPTTLDKKPFIGFHPQHPQLGIFNGFGARGSLTIPYHVSIFKATLLHKAALPKHLDIQRYLSS